MIDRTTLEQTIQSDLITDKEREAIQLVFIHGYGFVRAAELLNVSPRALRNRIDNARRKLHHAGHTHTTTNQPGWRELDLWLHQRQARVTAELHAPTTINDPRPAGDAFQLRGIPVVGVPGGIGATYPADKPGHPLAVTRARESRHLP